MTCTSWLVARMDSGSERNVPSASSVAATINNREWLTIFFMDPLSLAENKFSICGSKFCSRTSTHNNSGLILRLQKLDRDGQADYGSIGPPEQGRMVRNLASPSQLVGTYPIWRGLERVRWHSRLCFASSDFAACFVSFLRQAHQRIHDPGVPVCRRIEEEAILNKADDGGHCPSLLCGHRA